jgi:hypothetical protein
MAVAIRLRAKSGLQTIGFETASCSERIFFVWCGPAHCGAVHQVTAPGISMHVPLSIVLVRRASGVLVIYSDTGHLDARATFWQGHLAARRLSTLYAQKEVDVDL